MVSLPNVASHLRRIHGAHYRGHQGYPHPFEAIFGVRDRLMQPPKPFIVDAANVICHFGKDDPRLQNLLNLLLLLRRQRLDFFCLLMPNSEKLLRQRQSPAHAEIYARIVRYRRFFGVIPPNTPSAEIILALADYFGSAVVSNNKFRDYTDQYTWLNSKKRLVPFTISKNVLHLQGNQFSCDQGIGPLNKQLLKEFDQMRREASRGVMPKQNVL